MDLFNLYSDVIVRELEVLPGLIIDNQTIDNINYADKSVDSRRGM